MPLPVRGYPACDCGEKTPPVDVAVVAPQPHDHELEIGHYVDELAETTFSPEVRTTRRLRGDPPEVLVAGIRIACRIDPDRRLDPLSRQHLAAVDASAALAEARPGATFCYVSGEGTDSTVGGRTMWARVKGETENAMLRLPLDAYMFRPGFIRPRRGTRSKTQLYRIVYAVLGPLYPVLKRLAPAT